MLFYRSVFPEPALSPAQESEREAETLLWLKDYFQLNVDLLKLYDEWSERDAVFMGFRRRFEGIRVLRQDPWENLVSFICSSNNNITRITKMVKSLCEKYSPPLLSMSPPLAVTSSLAKSSIDSAEERELESFHPFPPPSRLAAADVSATLRSLGFGYRAEYIQKTAKMLVDQHEGSSTSSDAQEAAELWLITLRKLPTSQVRAELLKLMGVGRKVADCVLLMSMDKKEVIPVDTHVHQIAMKHYDMRGANSRRGASVTKQALSAKLYEEVSTKLMGVWGDYAGWAHSVLFTADLRSFSSYGLSTPTPSPSERPSPKPSKRPSLSPSKRPSPSTSKRSSPRHQLDLSLPTPPSTPAETLPIAVVGKKRGRPLKVTACPTDETKIVSNSENKSDADVLPTLSTLAERVKRRRRA